MSEKLDLVKCPYSSSESEENGESLVKDVQRINQYKFIKYPKDEEEEARKKLLMVSQIYMRKI